MLSVPLVAESVREVVARGPSASRPIGSLAPLLSAEGLHTADGVQRTWFANMVCTVPSFERADFRL